MMQVKVVRRPEGDAPEWVRDAWIGLILPTPFVRPRVWRVISPKGSAAGLLGRFRDVLRGRTQRVSGYPVRARRAIDILAETRPDAADWWRGHAAHMLGRGGRLLFDEPSCQHLGVTNGGAIWIPERFKRLFPASPGRIACLWIAVTLLGMISVVCFPGEDYRSVIDTLYFAGTSIFAGLLAAWVMRLRAAALHLVSALASLDVGVSFFGVSLKLALPPSYDSAVDASLALVFILGIVVLYEWGFRGLRSRRRRWFAAMLTYFVFLFAGGLLQLNPSFWRLSEYVRPLIGRADAEKREERVPDVEADILWEAQPALIAQEAATFRPRTVGAANVYAMAVAGSGAQDLFGREAHAALRAAERHFGATSRGGALLSNAASDQLRSPLATRGNIAAIAKAAGARITGEDVLFIYLASHGSRTAELQSDLPSYVSVQVLSSRSLAKALGEAKIKRRIVVVSACFAASWFPELANDDTIVIAAAAKDRTSFGCDDSRDLTVFGEFFLGSLASPNRSLQDTFEDAKRKITVQETKDKVSRPSLPQAYVGRNMEALWSAKPGG